MSKRRQGLAEKRKAVSLGSAAAADQLDALDGALEDAAQVRPDPEDVLVNGRPLTPLAELSVLMGFEVEDVQRGVQMRHPSGVPGLHQPRVWFLVRAPGVHLPGFTSHDVRSADRLNELTFIWGRPLSMPRLTGEDGRRLLRLMHEHLESKQQQQEAAR